MTDDIPDQPTGQAGAEPDPPDRETQLLASLSMALRSIPAELEEIRAALEAIGLQQGRQWALEKRVEAALTRIEKAFQEGTDESQGRAHE
jgi:hypothetical protein